MGNKMTAVEWVFDKMLDVAAGNSSLTTQEILEKGIVCSLPLNKLGVLTVTPISSIIICIGNNLFPSVNLDAVYFFILTRVVNFISFLI